jgi:hypothetical protein
MESLRQAVERAIDDVIVELTTSERVRWRTVEAAARRLMRAARELDRLNQVRGRV